LGHPLVKEKSRKERKERRKRKNLDRGDLPYLPTRSSTGAVK